MTSDGAAAKKSAGGTSFDRIKPANTAEPKAGPVVDARVDDVQGKRALFSGAPDFLSRCRSLVSEPGSSAPRASITLGQTSAVTSHFR